MSWLQKLSLFYAKIFHPVPGIHAPTKKTREFLEISGFFWAKNQKNAIFGNFRTLVRPRGPFKVRKGVRSCSLTYSEEIGYFVADFGPNFFPTLFPEKIP